MRTIGASIILLVGLLTIGGGGAANAAPRAVPPAFSIESARIPAACGHPAVRLTGGVKHFGTRPDGSSRGDASLVSRSHSTAVPIRKPLLAKQTAAGHRIAAEVAPIRCSAGGVDYPHVLVVYGHTGAILAATSLGRIAKQEHASVTSLTLHGTTIRARWDAYEGAGFDVHHQSATFTYNKGKLTASHISRG